MKSKQLITFLIILILPIAILAWLGMRIASNEQVIVTHKINELLLSKLVDYEDNISQLLEERERDFLKLTSFDNYKPDYLRNIIRKENTITQLFVVDSRGSLVYPSKLIALNMNEKKFLVKTAKIWEDKKFLMPKQAKTQLIANSNINLSRQREHRSWSARSNEIQLESIEEQKSGWFVWYWENGINLLFWRKLDNGNVLGVEMNKTMFIADVIGNLPDTTYQYEPSFRMALFDSKDDIIYQWGKYNPNKTEKEKVSLSLTYPLNSWNLKYFANSAKLDSAFQYSTLFSMVIPLICVIIIFAISATYFYRESKRQMNEATTKVNFVNRVSHELKTPLTNIRMYAELLENTLTETNEKSLKYLQIINNESCRLSRLISNVLTFSRKQNQKLKFHSDDIDKFIEALIEQFKPVFETKDIKIEFKPNINNNIFFASDAIEQILTNLFSNVEKYAAEGKYMCVETQKDDDSIIIKVSDKGPGIPEKLKVKIFNPFYRINNELSDGVSGTGIGLSIVKELTQLHNGNIQVISSNSGACFEITIKVNNESINS